MATLPNPHTWVAGDDATSGNLQTLTDAINFLKDPPRCHAYKSAAVQTLTTAVVAGVTFDLEEVDTDTIHSIVTNTSRFTIVTAGRYRFFGQVTFASNATGTRAVGLYKNGTGTAPIAATRLAPANGATHIQQVADEILLGVGDYIELGAIQTSGGNLDVQTGSGTTFLHAVWVSNS